MTLHAEPQDDGSVSALTADEVQVIQVRPGAGAWKKDCWFCQEGLGDVAAVLPCQQCTA